MLQQVILKLKMVAIDHPKMMSPFSKIMGNGKAKKSNLDLNLPPEVGIGPKVFRHKLLKAKALSLQTVQT